MDLLSLPLELDLIAQDIEDLSLVPWTEHQVDPAVRAADYREKRESQENVPNGSLSLSALQSLLHTKQGKYVSLNLHDNRLQHLRALPFLPSVRELNLSSNRFSSLALPELVSQLPSLTHLDLSSNRISSLAGMPFLPRLRSLSLSFNVLLSVDHIAASLPNLEELDLRGNRLQRSADLDGLEGLHQLRSLSLCLSLSSQTASHNTSHTQQTSQNLVCQRVSNVVRLFHRCESLRTVDEKTLSQWEELFVTQEREREREAEREKDRERERERIRERDRETYTPHFDKVSQRFKALHTQQERERYGESDRDRDRDTDRDRERASSFSSLSVRTVPTHTQRTSRTATTQRNVHSQSPYEAHTQYHTPHRAQRERDRESDEHALSLSLSPTQSRVLFPPRSHSHRDKDRDRERHTPRERYSERQTQTFTDSEGVYRESDDDEPHDASVDAHTDTPLSPQRTESGPHNSHSQTQTDPETREEGTQTEYTRAFLQTLTRSLSTQHGRTRTHTLIRAWHRLHLTTVCERMQEEQQNERASLVCEHERRLLTERTKHDQLQRRVLSQEKELLTLREEKEALSLQESLRESEREAFCASVTQNYEQELSMLREGLSVAREEMDEREKVLNAMREECISHRESALVREREMSELRRQLGEKERERCVEDDRLREKQREAEREMSSLRETLTQREREISRLAERDSERAKELDAERTRCEEAVQRALRVEREKAQQQQQQQQQRLEEEQQQQHKHQHRLESRLLKMQQALDELSQTNAALHRERDELFAATQRDKKTIKELSKCVKKLQEIADLRRTQEHSAADVERLRREKEELQREKEREKQELVARERERLRVTSEQLSQLEGRLRELQASKQQLETALSVKEIVVRDQAQELQQWRERQSSILEELSLSRQEQRMESSEREAQLRALEEENAQLLQRLAAKERLEQRVRGLVSEHLVRYTANSSSLSSSLSGLSLGNNEGDDEDLAMLLESVDWSALRQSQESENSDSKGRDTRRKSRSKRGDAGIAELTSDLHHAKKVPFPADTQHSSASKDDDDFVCSNRLCQERIAKLQRLAVEYQRALQQKNEECEIVSQALNRLEQKTKDISAMMTGEKKEFEKTIDKYRADKKKLSKLCKALEEDLSRKDEELKKIHAMLTELRNGPSALAALSSPKAKSSKSSLPSATLSSPPLRPPPSPETFG